MLQNYLRAETIAQANALLVDAQARIALAQAWGGGEVASADGLRFRVPVRTINAGSNPKYFGLGAGVTYFNMTSDQFSGLHYLVIPGTLKDGPYLLAVLLEQETNRYRRRFVTQLNRGESRHSLARAVFHGQKGELRQRYREGQEDQLGALGLVINILVLWSTQYMDLALTQLRKGVEVRDEDVARLSPLGYGHVNLLGRYEFALPESIARGAFRPLRDPSADAEAGYATR